MAYSSHSGTDLLIDVGVLIFVIALVPKNDIIYAILLSFIAITIVAIESRVRGFRLTGYMADGVNAFRPIYWATALLLLVLYHKPVDGADIWGDPTLSFFITTMLLFLSMMFISYRAASSD